MPSEAEAEAKTGKVFKMVGQNQDTTVALFSYILLENINKDVFILLQ